MTLCFLSLLGYLQLLLFCALSWASDPIQVSVPSSPQANNVVYSNFFGISFELSFVGNYFGNSTTSIPQPFLNYLANLHALVGSSNPLRIRIGGNSMDDSTYVPSQTSPLFNFTNPQANANDQPVNFGPLLWDMLKKVGDDVGGEGIRYLLGLTLRDPNSTNVPLLAGGAMSGLGSYMDAFILGNEPDLYTSHGDRPNLSNYTVQDYIGDYTIATNNLKDTSSGDLTSGSNIAGPTICCDWDLATVLQQGWLDTFKSELKYITLQHYPQNNCFGGYKYGLDYYLDHSNVVDLTSWQAEGITYAGNNSKAVVMSEFNSASCGGIPGISDTFGAALWTVDYALQMAAVGYDAAYIHTREPGISYNLFEAPGDGQESETGGWTTNPPYYSMMVVAETLGMGAPGSGNGRQVMDLDVGQSREGNSTVAGYAVYDSSTHVVNALVLFNNANDSSSGQAQFSVPASTFSSNVATNVSVKFLTASNVTEKTAIAWGGETLAGVGDGKPVAASQNSGQQMDCSNGCTISVPGPGLAVVFPSNYSSGTNSSSGSSGQNQKGAAVGLGFESGIGGALLLLCAVASVLCLL